MSTDLILVQDLIFCSGKFQNKPTHSEVPQQKDHKLLFQTGLNAQGGVVRSKLQCENTNERTEV